MRNYTQIFLVFQVCICLSYHFLFGKQDKKLIRLGRAYVRALYRGQEGIIPVEDGLYLRSIVAIMQHLYDLARQKGQTFTSGAIVVHDKSWKLHAFLKSYVRKMYQGDLCKEILVTRKNVAYPRKSTHLNNYYRYTGKAKKRLIGLIKKLCDYVHFGIDVKKLPVPVDGRRHFLFGKIGEVGVDKIPLLFIKFETAGLGIKEVLKHTVGLLKSQIRRRLPKLLEKFKAKFPIKLGSQKEVSFALGGMKNVLEIKKDQLRRENVPFDVMTEFLALILSPDGPIEKKSKEKKDIYKKAKALGIHGIIDITNGFIKKKLGNQKWRKSLGDFIQGLKKAYDNTHLRFGNEVILTNIMQ